MHVMGLLSYLSDPVPPFKKKGMPDSQQCPYNLQLINNMKYLVVFPASNKGFRGNVMIKT